MFVYQVATLYLAFIMAITLNAAVCKLSSNVGHRGYDIEFYYTRISSKRKLPTLTKALEISLLAA